MRVIRGAGGGGGKGGSSGSARSAVESPDSLRSRQYARVLDLVTEGECGGLVNGLRSVYLDETPVMNPDGSLNFSGVTLDTRNGTQWQSHIPGFGAVEAETAVSVEATQAAPVVRSVSNANANAVRVTVSVPQLKLQNTENGDIGGTSVDLAIDLQTAGGGYVQRVYDTISGKTTSRYQRSYRIELSGAGPWDIRVRRITADSTSAVLSNKTYWDSYTEIIDAKLRYPNSALVALSIDAERFDSIPKRGYEMLGIHVRIPSNYNPVTRAYSGVWDGSFTTAWTDNPAWCFYDLLTETRYGLGDFIAAGQVDKWALYQIAQYCDELVSDGFGGMEPRFTCNLYLQTREEAYRVITNFAAIFCGMAFWGAGSIMTVQDAPADPVKLFTNANVTPSDGIYFNYSGSSIKARHTVALVSWNDPDDRYKQKIEYVEDVEGIAKYGIIQSEVVALGCTSRGQAHRYGRRILYTERMETETVTFRAGMDGLDIAPGDVIQTSDPVRAGARMGGRLIASTASALTLDSSVTLSPIASYTLWAVLPDGTVESRSVTTGASTTDALEVSPAFTNAPQAMAMWVLAASNLAPETWRVISISEADGTQAEISALKYSPGKYADIEQGIILDPLQTSSLATQQETPTDLVISEELYLVTPVVVGARITASWSCKAQYYELQYRIAGGNWSTVSTSTPSADIQPADPGVYEFILTAINSIGRRSQQVTASKVIYGKTALPVNVSGFNLAAIAGIALITFTPATDLDVIVGGYLRVRHTVDTVSPDWSNAVDIGVQIPGTSSSATLPLIPGVYLAKWIDSSGNQSQDATGIMTDAPNVLALNMAESRIEHPSFSGTKTGLAVSSGALVLDSSETIGQQLGLISTWPRLSAMGGISTAGEYLFSSAVDLGSVQTSRLTAALMARGYDALDLIGERPLVSSWASVVGTLITDVDCVIYIRTTNDNPIVSPLWSAWTPFIVSDYTARSFGFKAVLSSNYPTHNIRVSQLAVTVDMADRTESGNDITSGTGTYAVVYSTPFFSDPALGITAQNMATGDYYQISSKSTTGFSIAFRNAAGSAVSRTFDYVSKGY